MLIVYGMFLEPFIMVYITHFKNVPVLRWTVIFLVIAIIAALLGFTGIAGAAADIAKFLFFLFIAIFVIIFLLAMFTGRKML